MTTPQPTSKEILADLIQFDTTSRLPNRDLIEYIVNLLDSFGIESTIIPNDDASKANLYCTVGPQDTSGVMLSGHTDVVPINGQHWTRPAFELTEDKGKLYGRGTTDMKGFVACALSAAIKASQQTLKTPLHLGFSYDEEIGCVGVHSLIDLLQKAPIKPAMCIVGEPTELKVATQQKGKLSIIARCIGREGHSALAPYALNAIHLATDLVGVLREIQTDLSKNHQSKEYTDTGSVPYTTVHAGNIVADQALNIVPNLCVLKFEIRYTADTNPTELLNLIQSASNEIILKAKRKAPEAAI